MYTIIYSFRSSNYFGPRIYILKTVGTVTLHSYVPISKNQGFFEYQIILHIQTIETQ